MEVEIVETLKNVGQNQKQISAIQKDAISIVALYCSCRTSRAADTKAVDTQRIVNHEKLIKL